MDNKFKPTNLPRKYGYGFGMQTSNFSNTQIIAYGDTISDLTYSVINCQNIDFTLKFMKNFAKLLSYTDFEKIEASILRSKDDNAPFYLVRLAEEISKNSNVINYDYSRIEAYVLASKKIQAITGLASYASKEYFKKALTFVCDSNDAHLIFEFAKYNCDTSDSLYKVNVNRMHEAIIKTENKYWIVEFEVRIMHRMPTFWENFWHDGFKDYPQF